ncbi:MAG: ribosomal L7Ae/L30e/S12e/Gadd45 family protein [Ruminococcus sp.]|nr:ribosomal L7Ae/L30e/S12e/Gadd45 family protein [Ruminococcus sp.]
MNLEKNRKTADLLTICNKARKTVKGFDSVKQCAAEGKAFCVITASDASPKTIKETEFVCGRYGVPVLASGLSKDELAGLCGKSTAVVAVTDKGFAEAFGRILGAEK